MLQRFPGTVSHDSYNLRNPGRLVATDLYPKRHHLNHLDPTQRDIGHNWKLIASVPVSSITSVTSSRNVTFKREAVMHVKASVIRSASRSGVGHPSDSY
jgi:hypothetical protein